MGTVVVPGYIVAAETMKLRADCREMGKKVDPRQTGKPATICNAYGLFLVISRHHAGTMMRHRNPAKLRTLFLPLLVLYWLDL